MTDSRYFFGNFLAQIKKDKNLLNERKTSMLLRNSSGILPVTSSMDSAIRCDKLYDLLM